MTRLSRVVTAVNWHYAVGEVVLIVAGILIALALADWNDRRLERIDELEMLTELRDGLEKDLVTIETGLEVVLEAEQRLQSLQELLADPQPYDSSMDALFGAVYGTRIVFLDTASFETLKSSGLQTISNDALRARIAQLFSESYEIMKMNNDIDMAINLDLIRSFYLQHFHDLDMTRSATPIDYDQLVADTYYRNLVDYRLMVLQGNRVHRYALVVDEIREVLAMLNTELGDQDASTR